MSTPTTAKSTAKTAKKSRVVTLKIHGDKLARFPSNSTPKPSIPLFNVPPPTVNAPESTGKTSESNGTPIPSTTASTDNNTLAPPKVDRRRRGGAAANGRKRAPPSIDPNGPMRERGRPGPKKKPRLPDGSIDHSQDGTTTKRSTATTAPSRLGPKANTGNINANLRALDRTGKPCRKWERKPLQIKSFTGVMWGLGHWKAPLQTSFPGDVKSDTTGSSDLKPNDSSAVASDRSHSGGDVIMTNGAASSPAPPLAA
ncbi:hypothetical protein LTR56_018148 [Elasticomyces elasticus]|nr:hypothetical protein LTR22_023130 [Elasticomyces elasticus]KAK3629261.1 hypothetical protein LTR56_018148 [Elasticomyces elasticus]KAK4895335.1 hypothetical protein LTR27_006678 [Elasticomyces elasticus]KAK4912826.1 hypothetical protein LTR49_018788 [Elasticomyces elasticus]KAK4950877.1 hypothetical protein LTR10_010870 [Elasticomyces elasticus]